MKITDKFIKANRKKINEVNKKGLNRHFGKENLSWNGGNRLKGNYPCLQCGSDRECEKRDSYRICLNCYKTREKKFNWKEWRKKVHFESKEFAIRYKGGKCVICGVKDLPACCYHFHHKNPKEKDFTLGSKFNQKISEKIIKELDKCDLYCANCHSIETWKAKNVWDNRVAPTTMYS